MASGNRGRRTMTQSNVNILIAKVPKDKRANVVCSLIGHSRIVTGCFGYIYCGRCGSQVADKLGGAGYLQAEKCVQVGHNCPTCRKNFRAMGWIDKFMVPNPFNETLWEGR